MNVWTRGGGQETVVKGRETGARGAGWLRREVRPRLLVDASCRAEVDPPSNCIPAGRAGSSCRAVEFRRHCSDCVLRCT
jgi:hypothetical protein